MKRESTRKNNPMSQSAQKLDIFTERSVNLPITSRTEEIAGAVDDAVVFDYCTLAIVGVVVAVAADWCCCCGMQSNRAVNRPACFACLHLGNCLDCDDAAEYGRHSWAAAETWIGTYEEIADGSCSDCS